MDLNECAALLSEVGGDLEALLAEYGLTEAEYIALRESTGFSVENPPEE